MSQIEDPSTQPPADDPSAAAVHRRRARRFAIPRGSEEQADFLEELARRVTPSFDFFLFSLLAGLALGVAILVDAPAFYVLTALLAPFMAPVAGLAFSTVLGSGRFLLQAAGALLTGSLILFGWGTLVGWLARLIPGLSFQQTLFHARLSWPDAVLVVLGAGLTAFTLVRWPQQRPLVTSVALAYELYLPVGVAGFGLGSGIPGLFVPALLVYVVHLALAALAGAFVLILVGLRPRPTALLAAGGMAVALIMALALLPGQVQAVPALPVTPTPLDATTVATLAVIPPTQPAQVSQPPAASSTPQPATPTPTRGPTGTPTNTLIPTRTPTITTTPIPTPVWAYVSSDQGGGVIVHEEPGFNTPYVASLINGVLVIVLSDAAEADGVAWVRVRTPDGREGWVVRSLLSTATPAPDW